MGQHEIAVRLNKSRQWVQQLYKRPDWPKEYATLSMGRVWLTEDIESWISNNIPLKKGRPVKDLEDEIMPDDSPKAVLNDILSRRGPAARAQQAGVVVPPPEQRYVKPADIDNQTAYHPPANDFVRELHERVREQCNELMHWINDNVPEGPEKTIAIRRVRSAMMWANASIACNVSGDPEYGSPTTRPSFPPNVEWK